MKKEFCLKQLHDSYNKLSNSVIGSAIYGEIQHAMDDGLDKYGIYIAAFGANGPLSELDYKFKEDCFYDKIIENFREIGGILVAEKGIFKMQENARIGHECWLFPEVEILATLRKSYKTVYVNDIETPENIVETTCLCVTQIVLLYQGLKYTTKYEDFFNKITGFINDNKIIKTKERASINMLCGSSGDYYMKNFDINDKVEDLIFPDLYYGEGFEEFDKNLVNYLLNENEGLVLLHGQPGTGKTFYIKSLLKRLALGEKPIVYAPPGMAEAIADPSMISFLSDWLTDIESDCIFLIEDAEPLLMSRESGTRTTGISNLLNGTQGILNDILGMIVIATFNTELENIDSALLRSSRLRARKKFNTLSENQAKEIAKIMNVKDFIYKDNMTLADIKAKTDKMKLILHGDISEKKTIGFGK